MEKELTDLHLLAAAKYLGAERLKRGIEKARQLAFYQTAFSRIYWLDTEVTKLRSDVDTPDMTVSERQIQIYKDWISVFETELQLLKSATGFQDFFLTDKP